MSLRFKINLAIIATGIFILLSILVVVYPFERERRVHRMRDIHLLINTLFQQNKTQLANEIYARQQEALILTLQHIQQPEDISHVLIYDLNGQCIAAAPADAPRSLRDLSPMEINTMDDSPRFAELTLTENPYTQFISAIEVIGVHVGYIRILYDLHSYVREARLIFFFSGVLFLILMLIIIFLNLFLTHAVIHPTARLKHAMQKLQQGDLTVQISIPSVDEIGQMASAFNAMSQKLNRHHRELTDAIASREAYGKQLHQSNHALEQLNANLEERVEERTRELKNANQRLKKEMKARQQTYREKQILEKRMIHSKKMETLGLVAGGVAHDLNNVLSGIVSYPDLLLMDLAEDHPMYSPMLTIKESGQKAATIVQDLLTLTRRGVVNNEILNPAVLVSEYLSSPEHHKIMMFHPLVNIKTVVAPNVMNIKGSPVHLKKTIMNLISNAAEALPRGGKIQIRVENKHVDTPVQGYQVVEKGDYVVIAVADKGIGISAQDQEHLFEPFYTKKAMGRSGTGLGMAVVWGTMQDHNGYIDIESEADRGTTFHLYFPVTTAPLSSDTNITPLDAYMGDRQTILVVDDLPEQLDIAALFLTKLGYTPASARSGEAAVAYLTENTAALIILDMIMEPGMDGLETYQKILEIHPDQRAVIVSGYAENDRVKSLQALGAGAYIKKPYTLETLGKAVKTELNR